MKALISFGLTLHRGYAAVHARLSRTRTLLAWWWMLRSRDYIVLRDLVVSAPGTVIHIGLLVVSTRGVFVVKTLDSNDVNGPVPANGFERGQPVVACYDDPMHDCEEHARQIAHVIEESASFVSPVLVLPDPAPLPVDRPAHIVSGRGVVDYIRSFRVEVFSSRRTRQIVSQLAACAPSTARLAARAA